MNLVELTEVLVKSLVNNEDGVSVKEFPTDDENVILIQVLVADEDMGRVVGKDGKVAKALRTLVQTAASLDGDKFVKIDIDKF